MLDIPDQLSPDDLVQVATQCACGNFRKATRAVTQFFDECLEPTGLRSTQFVILAAVGAMQPTSIARLAREHNRGKPFPQRKGRIRTGRPVR